MILELLLARAMASTDLPGEEVYQAKPKVVTDYLKHRTPDPRPPAIIVGRGVARESEPSGGNLPSIYMVASGRESTQSELIQPRAGIQDVFKQLKVGEKLEAVIDHSVIAFPDEKSPVVAKLTNRRFQNIKLIGESQMEKNSHRIFIDFTRVVVGDKIYQIRATGLTASGQPGFMGEYHSREAELFSGEFLASFVAGYFDGMVPRHTNAFGQQETDATVDSAIKKGLSAGAMSTADRFREKLKRVPEFSELRGPIDIEVLILEQAIEKPTR